MDQLADAYIQEWVDEWNAVTKDPRPRPSIILGNPRRPPTEESDDSDDDSFL